MTQPWTDTDVRAIVDAWRASDYDDLLPLEYIAPLAAIAASALAAAGRLTPADTETRTEYNLRFRKPSGWCVDDALTSTKPEDDWAHTRRLFGADVHQVSRTVTEYPDGSYLVGPWLPVPEEDTVRALARGLGINPEEER